MSGLGQLTRFKRVALLNDLSTLGKYLADKLTLHSKASKKTKNETRKKSQKDDKGEGQKASVVDMDKGSILAASGEGARRAHQVEESHGLHLIDTDLRYLIFALIICCIV